jgi:hypothetical protein
MATIRERLIKSKFNFNGKNINIHINNLNTIALSLNTIVYDNDILIIMDSNTQTLLIKC